MLHRFRDRIRGWRTVIFHGALTSCGAVLLSVDELKHVDWSQLVSPKAVILIGIGLSLASIWLRFITTGPVGCSKNGEGG